MPSSIRRESIPDLGEHLVVTIADEQSGGALNLPVVVSPDTDMLVVAVTDAGPDGENRGPRSVSVRLRDSAGREYLQDSILAPDGRQAVIIPNPGAHVTRVTVRRHRGVCYIILRL